MPILTINLLSASLCAAAQIAVRAIANHRQPRAGLGAQAFTKSARAFIRAWSRFELVPHRRPGSRICVATALAVHSDPWPVTFLPLPIESSRACPALAVSRSQTPGFPMTCLADWTAEERAGLSFSSACLRQSQNIGCSKYRTGTDGAHGARGADRSALRRRGARALGLPRWRRARRFHPQALPPPLIRFPSD